MFEEVPDIGENAFKGGFLSRKFTNNVIDHCNLWHHLSVKLPSSRYGSAKFIIAEDKAILDLTKVKFDSAEETFPLKLINASTSTLAKVRVVLGYVAGFKADAGMTAGTDSPVFLLTLPSAAATYYVLAKVTVGYTAATGLWTASACTIVSPAPISITANTSTLIYVNLGTATVVSNGSGGYRCSAVTPAVAGSQAVARVGNSTTYADYSWL